jgi:hypothetical protein
MSSGPTYKDFGDDVPTATPVGSGAWCVRWLRTGHRTLGIMVYLSLYVKNMIASV